LPLLITSLAVVLNTALGFLLVFGFGPIPRFGVAGAGILLPMLYPKVGTDVLQLAFGGVLLMAITQPAKILSSVLGNGVLASGGDTRFVLIGNLTGTYLLGLPIAAGVGLLAKFGFFGVFAGKILEEVVKAALFFFRFRGARWYAHGLREAREELKKEQSGDGPDFPEDNATISL
jgi:Na+-driven multidrug efflux pump